ncbi:hypothetical protein T265_03521 [Opisthorchis viverrini]|uniref:Uncharacterized protein n=1 Tax=Opisthorchis viverrini TaxID=6198 RepID=A0A075AHI2_OPIVI|nr:hypothetical protein T265_03521 [Opisthorchis viverrini]KER29929.1 hypothetical protein T265_03521 [Opisthorchis viverrini]
MTVEFYLDSALVCWWAPGCQAISAVPEIRTAKEQPVIDTHLKREADNGERIFADIPWSERSRKNTPHPTNSTNKHTNDCSLIILGVPEPNKTSDKIAQNTHDYLQWQFLCSTLEVENAAVVDTYRIPKSPKYLGTGPRPLKLTLLRGDMLNLIQAQWQRHRNLLPRELRINTSMRNNIPTEETKVNEDEAVGETSKNDQLPTLPGSAQL